MVARVLKFAWLAVSSLALCACEARVSADDEVLHEYVPDLKANEAEIALAAAGELPAIEHNGTLYTEPEGGPLRNDEAAMTAAAPDVSSPTDEPGVRSTVYYPDRQTALDGTLDYFEVFSPAIAPYKRVTALDQVVLGADGRTPGLTRSAGARVRVSIESKRAAAPDERPRDRFWGSVVLDFRAGDAVPLPSVSPESRVLEIKTEPSIGLRIEKDGADNFYAVRTSRNTPEQVRLNFLTDAPTSYFAAPIPDVPVDSLRAQVLPLEQSIQRRALRVADELGLAPTDRLPKVLSTLTEHFRSFVESKQPPPNTGDVYLDLARGKKGICRHRSYAFVITAQALGIPTRFVQNEAHSWVEIKAPTLGWLRIDLGGAANGLNARNDNGEPDYQPNAPDSLPRPAEYEAAYAQAQRGAPTQQPGQTPQTRVTPDTLEGAQGQWVTPDKQKPASEGERTGVGLSERAARADDVRGKQSLSIALDHTAANIYRGGMLQVSGRMVDDAREPVSAMRVEIALRGTHDERMLLLGVAVSDAQGYFHGSYGIPTTLAVGDYSLRVISPGNDRYLPAIAE